MLLRQRQKHRIDVLNQKLQSTNLDLDILNRISQKNKVQTKQKPTSNLSLNQLANILKKKNQDNKRFRHQKYQTRQWLRDKGVDVKRLNEEIRQNADLSLEIPPATVLKRPIKTTISTPLRVAQQESKSLTEFAFNQKSQKQHHNKQKRMLLFKTLQKDMKKQELQQANNFNKKCVEFIRKQNKTMSNAIENISGKSHSIRFAGGQTRRTHRIQQHDIEEKLKIVDNTKAKESYFKFLQAYVLGQFNSAFDLLKTIKPFWKIVIRHINTIDHYLQNDQKNELSTLDMNSFLMIKSLKMVQRQFQKQLPNLGQNFEGLKAYVRQLEISNKSLKIWRNNNGRPLWAMAYFLLKAGRTTQFKQIVEQIDRELAQDFQAYQESIKHAEPQASIKNYSHLRFNDSFFNQLIYIIKGKTGFISELILDNQLDKTWVMLRSMGIFRRFPDHQNTYRIILNRKFQRDAQFLDHITDDRINNNIYLGAYKQLVSLFSIMQQKGQLNEQSYITFEDYMHFLLILKNYPQLWGDNQKNQAQFVNEKYLNTLLKYLHKLQSKGEHHKIPYYLLSTSLSQIEWLLQRLITNRQSFENFRWRIFRDLLCQRAQQNGKQIFDDFQSNCLQKIQLKTFQDILFRASHHKLKNQRQHVFMEHHMYTLFLLKSMYFQQRKQYQIMKGTFDDQAFMRNFSSFLGVDMYNIRQFDKKYQKLTEQIKRVQRQLCNQYMKQFQHDTFYAFKVAKPFNFYKQFKKLTFIMNQHMQNQLNYKQFKKFTPQWYMEKTSLSLQTNRHQGYFDKISHNLLSLLAYLGQIKQQHTTLVDIYVFYLAKIIRRSQSIHNLQNNYDGSREVKQHMLRFMWELDQLLERIRRQKSDRYQIATEKEQYYDNSQLKEGLSLIYEHNLVRESRDYQQLFNLIDRNLRTVSFNSQDNISSNNEYFLQTQDNNRFY